MGIIGWLLGLAFWPPIFQLLLVPGLVTAMILVIIIIWFERKAAARVQMRVGPLYVSPRIGGALQLVADLIRFMTQEIIVPRGVDRAVFLGAPLVGLVVAMLPLVVVPVSPLPETWPVSMDYSVVATIALITLAPLFIVAAAWASGNKFAVIGGLRESYLTVVYEVPLVASLLSPAALVGSLNVADVVEAQSGGKWFALLNPLAFLAAVIATLMATSGFPFEIAEAESEVVAGAFSEYSGLMYGLNMGATYIRRYVNSTLIALFFLGGWKPLDPQPGSGVFYGYLLPSLVVVSKAAILMAAMSILRAVYGRYRLDQALDLGWRIVFPLSLSGFGLSLAMAYLGVA
ncbi:NADH-quinone oxidoreductase subunit NuoH [Stetteria hydrogenophila]